MDEHTLQQLIGKMDKRKLIDLIGQIVAENPSAEQTLLVFCQKESPPVHKNLAEGNLLLKLWENARIVIHEATALGGCSDEEEVDAYDELEEISKLVQKSEISWEFRREVVDEMLEQIGLDNSGFTDPLADAAEEMCRTPEERVYYAERLAECGNRYYKDHAAMMLQDLGHMEKALDVRKANLEYGDDYLKLAGMLDGLGNPDAALEVALAGLDLGDGRLDGLYRYLFDRYESNQDAKAIQNLYEAALKKRSDLEVVSEWMYGYFKRKGDDPGQKRMLHALIKTCCNATAKKWYEQCRADFPKDEWQKVEVGLLQTVKKKNLKDYLDICMEKGDRKEVLDCVVGTQGSRAWESVDAGHRLSRLLARDYPDEILKLYWREVQSLIAQGKDREYRVAASTLKEIKAIQKSRHLVDEWQRSFDDLKNVHRRRKNFLREIAGL